MKNHSRAIRYIVGLVVMLELTLSVQYANNPSIDGLLGPEIWDTWFMPVDGPNTLNYGFPIDRKNFGWNGYTYWYGTYSQNDEPQRMTPATEAQKVAFRRALAFIGEYTGLKFAEVDYAGPPPDGSDPQAATLTLANTEFSSLNEAAFGYYPQSNLIVGGDVWLNSAETMFDTPIPGSRGFFLIMHELGHAMGLKHGHESLGGTALPITEDHMNYSVMTYRPYADAPLDNLSYYFYSDQPTTYMQNDIAALQHIYGANFQIRSGDTTYRWNPSTGEAIIDGVGQGVPLGGKIFMTIWDGGGNDTYDLSNYHAPQRINLQPGQFSTFDWFRLADLNESEPGIEFAFGNIANARLYRGSPLSLIENATTGGGDDHIWGNNANNRLDSGSGNDTLEGYDGNDTLIGGEGVDILMGDKGNDVLEGSGEDVAVFEGVIDIYKLTRTIDGYLIANKEYGKDELRGIKYARFGETTFDLTKIKDMPSLPFRLRPEGGAKFKVELGESGRDKIVGSDGDDILGGGRGKDVLTGMAGADKFVFDAPASRKKPEPDTITDFSAKDDSIWLDNRVFTALGKDSPDKALRLKKAFFTIGAKARDADDRIVYDRKKGILSYDADGSGAQAAVAFAKVKKNLKLTAADFFVI